VSSDISIKHSDFKSNKGDYGGAISINGGTKLKI